MSKFEILHKYCPL